MSETVFVRPGEGRVVYREDGSDVIPEQGETVPLTTYYRRRLDDGDLVPASPRRARRPAAKADHKGEK